MDTIIFESKLNNHSLEELDFFDPNTSGIIIDKLLHLQGKFNLSHLKALKVFANTLCLIETKRALNGKTNNQYVRFSSTKDAWVCTRTVNGKVHWIKTSKNRDIVEKAHEEFCKLHNITL